MASDEKAISLAVPRPLDGLFTYRLPASLDQRIEIGGWVKVPFGRITTHAFVVEAPFELSVLPDHLKSQKLKEVLEVGPGGSVLPQDVLDLCRWAHEYYRAPLGEMINCAVPASVIGLRSQRGQARPLKTLPDIESAEPYELKLTSEQEGVAQSLSQLMSGTQTGSSAKVALLHGVTGSGKTEVYLQLAREALSQGKGVILLVPEIALTPQLHRRLEFGVGERVALWHSAVSDAKRRDEAAALREGSLRVVVGARSAVFAPVRDLGLIIVDEEHDPSYKQEDRVRYHARDLAVVRARITGATAILGSATPSLETRERVREGKYKYARLDQRYGSGGIPSVKIVNLREEERIEDLQAPFARSTLDQIGETLSKGEQVMIYLNRRGFSAFLVCADCGESRECPNCSLTLTYHKRARELRCHFCGLHETAPDQCANCRSSEWLPVGAGTESLEEQLPGLLPDARIIRLDRDQVTSASRLDHLLEDFRSGNSNLLLGTQMLVKGHDFPGVTLVVVVLADALFRWPDFRASERAFQILTQVSGRAGRGERPGEVLIQTFQPDHPVLQAVRGELSEADFLEQERELRQALGYPPFGRLARVRLEHADRSETVTRAKKIHQALLPLQRQAKMELLGPSEAFLEKARNLFRWDILIKSPEIAAIQRSVYLAKQMADQNKWSLIVDVDPYGT